MTAIFRPGGTLLRGTKYFVIGIAIIVVSGFTSSYPPFAYCW